MATSSKEKDDKKKDKEEKEAKEPKEKTEKKGKDEKEEKEKKEPEPNFEILQNPARVLRQQLKVIQLVEGSHYVPVKDIQIGGIVMVKHIQTDTEEELVEPVAGEYSRLEIYSPMLQRFLAFQSSVLATSSDKFYNKPSDAKFESIILIY